MKILTRSCIALILISLVFPCALAQESTLKEKVKKFKNSRRFSVRYDRFDDRTFVTVGPFFLDHDLLDPNNNFQMASGFSFAGASQSQPVEQYQLIFLSSDEDWKFSDNSDLKAIVDGERMALGEASRKSKVDSTWMGEVKTKETLLIDVPADVFNKIAHAKKVEMRLGKKEFKIKEEHRHAFRDLLSLTETSK
jgi:hypothetical protein